MPKKWTVVIDMAVIEKCANAEAILGYVLCSCYWIAVLIKYDLRPQKSAFPQK